MRPDMDIHSQLQARESRRLAAETRMLERLETREEQAEDQIGQLMRDGKLICYVCPRPNLYREGTRSELVAYLIRNRYA